MESTTAQRHVRLVSRYPDPVEFSEHRLELLRERITDAILQAAGAHSPDDQLLRTIVRAAMKAFVDARANTAIASDSMADLMEQIGARQARQGFDAAELTSSFRTALVASQKGLTLVVGEFVTRDTLVTLRERLVTYLSELHIHAHAGLVRGDSGPAAPAPDGADDDDFILSTAMAGLPMVAVVSISTPIPEPLYAHPLTVCCSSSYEILVPATWDNDTITSHLAGQAVVSPPTHFRGLEEILLFTRQAADLLHSGGAKDDRTLVPSIDLLAAMILRTSPLLARLAAEKHLHRLDHMAAPRRIAAGELLLTMLENGQVMAAAARELGVPRQTVFSRMKPLWALFGDALDDPNQCIELTVALHDALPRWRLDLKFTDSLDDRY